MAAAAFDDVNAWNPLKQVVYENTDITEPEGYSQVPTLTQQPAERRVEHKEAAAHLSGPWLLVLAAGLQVQVTPCAAAGAQSDG